MTSYVFPLCIDSDEDIWRAYVLALEAKCVATWGRISEEALKNIQEVAQMVAEELLEPWRVSLCEHNPF